MNDGDDILLEHFGTKGMRWGVRKQTGSQIRTARKELKDVSKVAGGLIKESKSATSQAQKRKVAEKYQKEVINKIKTKAFKEKFRTANTVTKGELVANTILSGGLGYVTLKSIGNDKALNRRYAAEVGISKEILREMRSP